MFFNKEEVNKRIISFKSSILSAMEMMNFLGKDLTLFAVNEKKEVVGSLTDGDIRRGLLNEFSLSDPVSCVMCKEFKYLLDDSSTFQSTNTLKNSGVRLLPLLSKEMKLLHIYNLEDVKSILPVDAIIMAGGQGLRLRPLTENTPKPLLKIGKNSIIDFQIKLLATYGIRKIHVSVNYRKEQIINYLQGNNPYFVDFSFLQEKKKLGTLGSVSLMDNIKYNDILITNADIISTLNLNDFYEHFKDTDSDICIGTIKYPVSIPFAILEKENDQLISIREKPSFEFESNAGFYLIKSNLISNLDRNTCIDVPDFISKVIETGKKVTSFPIKGFWRDLGTKDDYYNLLESYPAL